ncbi:MAG TPA: hypothetical protein VF615_02505 [Longimicrobiaceae bacterium]|jgi:hypothetical protein
MTNTRRFLALALVPALAVPLAAGLGAGGGEAAEQQTGRLTGRVWMRVQPAEPAGSFRVFLPNGSVLTGSCRETYRVDPWRMSSASRLTITEGTEAIPADVSFRGEELRLRIRLVRGGTLEERYRPARVPYLCPEGANAQ